MRFALSALASTLVLLASCSKEAPTPPALSSAKVERPEVQIDVTTPDRALKSYWALQDAIRAKHADIYRRAFPEYRASEKNPSSVVSGAVDAYFASKEQVFESFSRDIVDVKVESESRAVIVAVIKNSTPIPAGAEVSKFTEQERRDGQRYKYVLEKSSDGWRIAEIWGWETYSTPDWKKQIPYDGEPYVPSSTYGGR